MIIKCCVLVTRNPPFGLTQCRLCVPHGVLHCKNLSPNFPISPRQRPQKTKQYRLALIIALINTLAFHIIREVYSRLLFFGSSLPVALRDLQSPNTVLM